jgi:hypothetical protein
VRAPLEKVPWGITTDTHGWWKLVLESWERMEDGESSGAPQSISSSQALTLADEVPGKDGVGEID